MKRKDKGHYMSLVEINFSDIDLYDFGNTLQLSGMVMNRGNETILVPIPDEEMFDKIKVLKLTLPEWEEMVKQLDVLESRVLAIDGSGIKKIVLRKTTRQIDQKVSWAVYKRDDYKCRYCGADSVPLTVDHLVLWEDGGPSIMDNLVSSCRRCNKTRGNTPYKDWLNSAFYQNLSKGITDSVKKKNFEILQILDSIPLRLHQSNRNKKKKK